MNDGARNFTIFSSAVRELTDYDLALCPALHSACRYGQIAMLRQIQGLWPPAGGDDSW